MNNPLFITDLDGTLLNSKGVVSQKSVELLNQCIDEGMVFSVATARTPATVMTLLKDIKLKVPIVVMTGGGIFHPETKEYIRTESFNKTSLERIMALFEKYSLSALTHTRGKEQLEVYYQYLSGDFEQAFVNARANTPYKQYIQTESYRIDGNENPVLLFLAINRYSRLQAVYEKVVEIPDIHSYCYPDLSNPEYGYLEIFPGQISKASGIKYLTRKLDVDGIISFGDSVNDLTMFQISDECYATGNGTKQVKDAATAVLKTNDEDGVALMAARRFQEIKMK